MWSSNENSNSAMNLDRRFVPTEQNNDYNLENEEEFFIATRTQLLWGENALLCGDYNEASRTFLCVVVSFERYHNVTVKGDRATANNGHSSSMSIPLEGCRSIHSEPSPASITPQQLPRQQHVVQQQQQQQLPQQQLPQDQQQHSRRHEQMVTLLGSALYGLGTTFMLLGQFDHAQPALQQAVYLYWQVYGEGSPLLELARTQLHRLYCYWEMVQLEQQQQQLLLQEQQAQENPWLMPAVYPLPQQQQQQQQQHDELAPTGHERQDDVGNDDDDDDETDDDADTVFDDYDFESDEMIMFTEDQEFNEFNDDNEVDEHHFCYCPGEICRMFSRSVRHASAA